MIFGRAPGHTPALASFVGSLLLATSAFAAPDIRHSPPQFQAGSDLLIRAKITAPGGVLEPSLYFRKSGKEYARVALVSRANGVYEARIPASLLTGEGTLEYYIGAFAAKDLSEGFWRSKKSPYRLSLKLPERHVIRITTEPPNAILDLDGETVGPSPYEAPLRPGSHQVTARLAGYKPLGDFEFTMPKDKDLTLPFSLVRDGSIPLPRPAAPPEPPVPAGPPVAAPPEGKARVRVVTVPPGAELLVDGTASGTSPTELVLSPGAYIVSAKLDGYRVTDQIVKVAAGDAVQRVIKLRPAAPEAAQQ